MTPRVSRKRRPKTEDQRPRKGRPPRKRRPRKGRPPRKRRPRKGRPPRKRRPRKGRPPRKQKKETRYLENTRVTVTHERYSNRKFFSPYLRSSLAYFRSGIISDKNLPSCQRSRGN